MASKVIRITMFKLPSKEVQEKFKELYTILTHSAVKDGSPYILSLEAGPTFDDARSKGFNFVAKSEFASMDDMVYYDESCAAHQVLKQGTKPLGVIEVMTLYYTPAVVNSL